MKNISKLIMLGLVFCCCNGCASIITGSTQRVPVITNPSKAYVTTDSGHAGNSPCFFDLERGKEHIVTITKEGYKTTIVTLKRTMSGAYAGNIVVGGIIGLGVDAATGAMYKLSPEEINVDLEPGERKEEVVISYAKSGKKKLRGIKPTGTKIVRKGSVIQTRTGKPVEVNNKLVGLPAPATVVYN